MMLELDELFINELNGVADQDLVVSTGTEKRIIARTYRFGSVVIQKGAKLTIQENSIQWLILMISGDLIVDGEVVFEQFIAQSGDISATAPDGRILTHKFQGQYKCGRGGNGGHHWKAIGGAGSEGDISYGGGGGGSGAYASGGNFYNGTNANGRFGAKNVGAGGDGGAWVRGCNGGLIYLAVGGRTTGNGSIRVNGLAGARGTDGEKGWERPGGYGVGGGGGGGGAAGGDGGRIVIACNDVGNDLQFFANSGKKGEGGKGGRNANDGDPGQDGAAGYIDILST